MNGWHEFGTKETIRLTFNSSIEINPEVVMCFTGAAANGDVSEVVQMLEEGVPIDIVDENGFTALGKAVYNNQTDVIQVLLQRRPDVNQRGGGGLTALHVSAVLNRTHITRALLEHGASTTIKDDRGQTPIDLARQMNHTEAVLLLQH